MNSIDSLRKKFQRRVCRESIFLKSGHAPSIADTSSKLSTEVSKSIVKAIGLPVSMEDIDGQTAGKNFEIATMKFLEGSIALLSHLRPARWLYSVHNDISQFVQYAHLADLKRLVKSNKEALTALGDYVVNPDVVVARKPLSDREINLKQSVVRSGSYPKLSPLRGTNQTGAFPLLHASTARDIRHISVWLRRNRCQQDLRRLLSELGTLIVCIISHLMSLWKP